MAPSAEAKRITLTRHVSQDVPPIDGDPKRLHQILGNVLSNAIKFTPEGGSVAVRCVMNGDWLELIVRDSGIGIAPEFLPHVFERFRQADSQPTRHHGGLGLGLAIARHLVEQHRGEILADSAGPHRGTTVTIRLPAAGASAAITASVWTPPARPAVRLDDVAVLVVDDQPDSREMLAALLEHLGARVRQSGSADSALATLAVEPFQVVVADIAMPNVDGYELMRRLRASGNRTPSIAVTAFARIDDRQKAIASGYTEYCAKPIEAGRFATLLRSVIPAS